MGFARLYVWSAQTATFTVKGGIYFVLCVVVVAAAAAGIRSEKPFGPIAAPTMPEVD